MCDPLPRLLNKLDLLKNMADRGQSHGNQNSALTESFSKGDHQHIIPVKFGEILPTCFRNTVRRSDGLNLDPNCLQRSQANEKRPAGKGDFSNDLT